SGAGVSPVSAGVSPAWVFAGETPVVTAGTAAPLQCPSGLLAFIESPYVKCMSTPIDPSPILQTAFAFWNSKVLLTAVEMGVFTKLGDRRLTGAELGRELGLHARGIADFFDALVAMKFLERDGDGAAGRYFNIPAGAMYLDAKSPRYIGGILTMLNVRLFRFWHDLPEGLRTGQPQNETRHKEKSIFEELYADPAKLEIFLNAMTGLS